MRGWNTRDLPCDQPCTRGSLLFERDEKRVEVRILGEVKVEPEARGAKTAGKWIARDKCQRWAHGGQKKRHSFSIPFRRRERIQRGEIWMNVLQVEGILSAMDLIHAISPPILEQYQSSLNLMLLIAGLVRPGSIVLMRSTTMRLIVLESYSTEEIYI